MHRKEQHQYVVQPHPDIYVTTDLCGLLILM